MECSFLHQCFCLFFAPPVFGNAERHAEAAQPPKGGSPSPLRFSLRVCVCGHARFSNILYYATRKRVLQAYFVRKRGKTRLKKSFCSAKICLKEKFCEKFPKTDDFSKKGMEIRKYIWYNRVRRNSE
jgi:hypothetical protein